MYFLVNILHTASGTEGLTIKAKQKSSIIITSWQMQYNVFTHMLIYDINIIWLVFYIMYLVYCTICFSWNEFAFFLVLIYNWEVTKIDVTATVFHNFSSLIEQV